MAQQCTRYSQELQRYGQMVYRRDKYEFCYSKNCKKKSKWIKCPNCNGQGSRTSSHCGNNCKDGYKCENGVNDKWH